MTQECKAGPQKNTVAKGDNAVTKFMRDEQNVAMVEGWDSQALRTRSPEGKREDVKPCFPIEGRILPWKEQKMVSPVACDW